MRTMEVTGEVTVDELLISLGLAEIPSGSDLTRDEKVEITVSADRDALEDEIREDDDESDLLDQATVMGLAAAIRREDKAESERLLDRLFGDFASSDTITEWIQQGRFSIKARPVTNQSERLRAVA